MKPMITVAAGLALSIPCVAQKSQPVKVGNPAQAQTRQAVEAGTRAGKQLQQDMTALEEKVLAGEVPTEAFAGLKEEVRVMGESTRATNPKATELSRRLARRIADVEQRAKEGAATREDFSILREQMIDARVDNTIAKLASEKQASAVTPADLEQLGGLLEARAAAASQVDPRAGQQSQSVIRSLNAIQKKSGSEGLQTVDFAPLERSLAESRLERAMTDLEKRALANTASQEDYTRVKEVLADRTQTVGTPDAQALQERLQNAIDKLKAKAAAGELTQEEFTKIRTNLMQKARATDATEK